MTPGSAQGGRASIASHDLEADRLGRQAGALQVAARHRHCVWIDVARGDADRARTGHARGVGHRRLRLLLDQLPERRLVERQLLDAELPLQSCRTATGDLRGLDDDGACAAEEVHQRDCRIPVRQRQQAGRQVLLERCLALRLAVGPPAALEERFARQVEVEQGSAFLQEQRHPYVRPRGVDRWTVAGAVAQPVDDRVLDAQRGEVEAGQRRADRGRVDPQGAGVRRTRIPTAARRRGGRGRPRCDSGRARCAASPGSRGANAG